MFKKVLVCLFACLLMASPVHAGVTTVRNWMNETDASVKRNYAKGVHEGFLASYLIMAKASKLPQEKIDVCTKSIDSLNSNFENYTEATNAIIAYYLDNGGKTESILALVVTNAYLNTDTCSVAKGHEF